MKVGISKQPDFVADGQDLNSTDDKRCRAFRHRFLVSRIFHSNHGEPLTCAVRYEKTPASLYLCLDVSSLLESSMSCSWRPISPMCNRTAEQGRIPQGQQLGSFDVSPKASKPVVHRSELDTSGFDILDLACGLAPADDPSTDSGSISLTSWCSLISASWLQMQERCLRKVAEHPTGSCAVQLGSSEWGNHRLHQHFDKS